MKHKCKCGCYIATNCHHCGRPIGEPRNESAELAMLKTENNNMKLAIFLNRATYEAAVRRIGELQTAMSAMQSGELPGPTREHIRRVEAERDTALEAANRYRVALAAMQAVVNNRDTGLVDWFVQECGGPWTATAYSVIMLVTWWGMSMIAGHLAGMIW